MTDGSILPPRETKEECGLDVTDLDKVGVLFYEFVNVFEVHGVHEVSEVREVHEVHVFRTTHFSGEVTESEGTQHYQNSVHHYYYCLCY